MDAQIEKRACVVFVTATEDDVEPTRKALEEAGYAVCAVKAELEEALAAKEGQASLREEIIACVSGAELCIFLLPEDDNNDGQIGTAAGFAESLNKRLVGIVAGQRTTYPDVLEDFAPSMIRTGSERLKEAIAGEAVWERVDRTTVAERPIRHVKCQ